MVIDTSSFDSIKKTIIENFGLTKSQLDNLALQIYDNVGKRDSQFSDAIYQLEARIEARKIIDKYFCKQLPDEIMLFHLSRRLNGEEDMSGCNLDSLLTTKSVLSDFLKKYDVYFSKNEDGSINIIYKNSLISLSNEFQDGVGYLRNRLGHNKNRIDNCFNGFMFGYALEELKYTNSLRNGPEFLQCLDSFLKNQNLLKDQNFLNDYKENSTYYCFSYKLPLNKVKFDFNDKLTLEEKSYYLIESILIRIYEDNFPGKNESKINPILRLNHYENIPSEFFVGRKTLRS